MFNWAVLASTCAARRYVAALLNLMTCAPCCHPPCSAVPEALAHPRWGPTALQLLDLSSNHSHFLR